MTIYLLIFFIFTFSIYFLIKYFQQNNSNNFDSKQVELKTNISKQQKKLESQKQKVEIVEDLKASLKSNNQEIISKIVGMNNSLFEQIHSKKV